MSQLDRRIVAFVNELFILVFACLWTWVGMAIGWVGSFYQEAFISMVCLTIGDGFYLYRQYRKQKKARLSK